MYAIFTVTYFCSFIMDLCIVNVRLTLKVPETKISKIANWVDPDEAAHIEPGHLDRHSLSCSL